MSKTSPRKIKRIEKERKALTLRRGGASFEQIAKALGYSDRAGAWKAVMAVLKRRIAETSVDIDHIRTVELERVDAMLRAIWPAAMEGNLQAVDRVLRLMERRSRYLGLDAPVKQEVSGPDGEPIRVENARRALFVAIEKIVAEPDSAATPTTEREPTG